MTPILRAIGQLDDPALLGAVWRSAAWALVALVALGVLLATGGAWVAGYMTEAYPRVAVWLEWLGGAAGAIGAAVAGLFLFVPLATGVATLFVDRIAEAVERRHFPDLPPGEPASLAVQAWDGLALAVRVLAMQLVALVLSLVVPGLGLVLGWLVAAWAIGRGLFMAVAMRRCDRATATAVYRSRRGAVLVQGGLVAAAALVPVVNLIAPVLGLAAMVHVLGRPRSIARSAGLSRPPGA